MKVSDLREMRDQQPFRPFDLLLDIGAVLPCAHPDLLSFSPEGEDEVLCLWAGPQWYLIDADSVRVVETKVKTEGSRHAAN